MLTPNTFSIFMQMIYFLQTHFSRFNTLYYTQFLQNNKAFLSSH